MIPYNLVVEGQDAEIYRRLESEFQNWYSNARRQGVLSQISVSNQHYHIGGVDYLEFILYAPSATWTILFQGISYSLWNMALHEIMFENPEHGWERIFEHSNKITLIRELRQTRGYDVTTVTATIAHERQERSK